MINKVIKPCFLILIIMSSISHMLNAQGFTSSPYSVFGIGMSENIGFSENVGMGSAGVAMPSKSGLNALNPASYSSLNNLDFQFNIGMFAKISNYESQMEKEKGIGMGFRYLALGFKPLKRWGCSVGISPFSSRGYMILTENPIEGNLDKFKSMIQGSGSINQFYFSNSIELLKGFSAGINASYLFGPLKQEEKIIYQNIGLNDISIVSTNYFKNFYFDFGIQYHYNTNKHGYYFGLTYKPNQNLEADYDKVITLNMDTIDIKTEGNNTFKLPTSFGLGFGYSYKNTLKIYSDFNLEKWSRSKYHYKTAKLVDCWKLNFGIELNPSNGEGIRYRDHITYRIGYRYNKSNLEVRSTQLSESAISAGLSLPIRGQRSKINMSFEFGKQGTAENRLIKENYFRFMLGFELHDNWFMRYKYD